MAPPLRELRNEARRPILLLAYVPEEGKFRAVKPRASEAGAAEA